MKDETRRQAEQLCTFLTDHKAQEVSLIDISDVVTIVNKILGN